MLMDDLIIVEPDIGFRAYMSLGLAEAIFLKTLGPSSINLIKDLVEGSLDSTRIIWGLIYYADRLVRALPAPKLEKVACLLHQSDF